jgi:ADP-heptose:LPS heptosyltransferase
VGYARKSAFFLNRKIADRKEEGLRHEVDYNLELLRPIGINTAAGNFNDFLRLEENDFSQERMDFLGLAEGEFIVLHPWASNRQKEWGGFNFRRLFEKLGAQYQHKLVMIGAKEDLPRSEQLALELNLINLTGRTSLVELAGLLKKSRLLVTNDSGPMHLAGVLGVPTVALFRKSPPAVSARRWGPIGNRHIIIENEVLADIQISEVYDAVKKIITG